MNGEKERYERLMYQLRKEMGQEILNAVMEDSVTGIKVGGDGKVIVKRHSLDWQDSGARLDFGTRVRVLSLIANDLGKTINDKTPQLEGELPLTGSRIEGAVPPTAEAVFVIRRHSPRIYTLEDYVRAGIMEEWQAAALRQAVLTEKNIVVAGAVDSGKTTLVNTLMTEIDDMGHVIVVQDTKELRTITPNITFLQTSPQADMRKVLRSVLRMDFDRLIVGETRGAECYELIKLWDAGRRGGITTLHAEDAAGVLRRMGQFCLEAGVQPQWDLIRQVIDVIVFIKVVREGRKNPRRIVSEIVEVDHADIGQSIPVGLKPLGPSQGVTITHDLSVQVTS